MRELFKIVGGRVIGGLVATLCGWLLARYGVQVDAETQRRIVDAVINAVAGMFALFSIVYPIVAKWLNTKWNPRDVATPKALRAGTRLAGDASGSPAAGVVTAVGTGAHFEVVGPPAPASGFQAGEDGRDDASADGPVPHDGEG